MPFFMAGFEIAAYGSSESGIELESGFEELNVAAVKLVEEARERPVELCSSGKDPSETTAGDWIVPCTAQAFPGSNLGAADFLGIGSRGR